MKKFKNYLLFIFASVFLLIGKTNAVMLTEAEIPDGSYIIGAHMFTYSEKYPYTDLYDGNVNTAVVMLGSASFETEDIKSQDEFVIYNKLFEGFWLDTLTGDLIELDSYNFEILYVNGSCIDPSCSGKTYDITFRYNNDVTSNLVKTYNYLDTIEEPATPTKLGHKFVCWTLENSDDCYDFSTPVESDLILEASWSAYDYKITYVDTVNNKTKVVECNFTAGNECTYPEFTDYFVLQEGYTFNGWSLAESGEKVYTSDASFKALFGDTTEFSLYSIFNSSDYTISYNLNGGSFTSLQSPTTIYNPSKSTYDISTPTRVGYQFAGWTVTKGDATISDGKIIIKTVSNIEITANWTANTYNVVYNGTNLNTATCKYDSVCTLDLDKIIVAEGKQIKSITATVDSTAYSIGSTVKNLTTANNADVPVTVTFEDIYYNISYELNGGTVTSNPVKALINTNTTLNEPTKTGYTFSGWTVSSGTATISDSTLKITAENDVKLTANWTANTYNVYYNNGTSDILLSTSGCTYDEFCTLDLSKIVLASGYQLDHIEATIDGSTSVVGDKVYNLTTTANGKFYVTPVFEKIQYSITYNLNGGKITNENSSVITVGTTLTLTEPTREGYTFAGWEVTSGSANVTNTSVVLKNVGDVSLKAKWNVKQFTIDFDLNDGVGTVSSVSCTYVSCELPDTIPTKTGYDFEGWMYEGTLYEAGDKVTIEATGTITLTAKWVNSKVYKIKYDLDGGTFDGTPVITFIAGETSVLPNPTKDGYTFNGWYSGNTKITSVSGLTADVEVTAKWSPITYTIYLYADSEGNELLNEIYCEYDDTCGLGDNSDSFEHQRLLGWSKSAGGNVFYGDNLQLMNLVTNAGDNVHLYPVLEDVTDYIITYYLDGGSFVDADTVVKEANNGDSITLPKVEKLGYEVDYWITDSGTEITTDTYKVTSDVVLVPVWKKIESYTINFVHDFDISYTTESITCTFDSECILPTLDFDREGYNFDGWLLQLTGEGGNLTYKDGELFSMSWETAVDQGTFEFELTSQWSEITYDVYYVNENNENTILTTYGYFDDSVKISLNIASKSDGSTFVAWSLEDGTILDVCTDDTNYACLSVTELTRNIKLTPHYSDELVTVTYKANYPYTDRGEEQTASNNGSLSVLPGMKITGLPESVSYQKGPNTITVNIVGWTLDDVEIDLDEYVVTTDVELVAVFE